ncbi:hypothetical protein AYI70_g7833 [Smittium culicis]|uniref:Uncharacterized protein n=1 Tax=Smittium culicis TaxID=133412 RepID=A0A1R1XIN2_9FUNG|nr:hypothetical protein AYI70_g7833 [Smittium culicis]
MLIYTFYKPSPSIEREKKAPVNNNEVFANDQANIYNGNVNQKNKALDSNNEMEQLDINGSDKSDDFENFGIHPPVFHSSSQLTVDPTSKNSDISQELIASSTQSVSDNYRSEETGLNTSSRNVSEVVDSISQDSLLNTVEGNGFSTNSDFSESLLFSQVSTDSMSEIQSEKVSSGSINTDNNISESHTGTLESIKSESTNQNIISSPQTEIIEPVSTTISINNSDSSDDEEESVLDLDIDNTSNKDNELTDSLLEYETDKKSNFDKGNQDITISYSEDENESKMKNLHSFSDLSIDSSIKTTESDKLSSSSQINNNNQLSSILSSDTHLATDKVNDEKNEDDLTSNANSSEDANFDSDDDLSDKVNMRNTDSPKETLNKSVLGDDLNEIDLASSNFDALESDKLSSSSQINNNNQLSSILSSDTHLATDKVNDEKNEDDLTSNANSSEDANFDSDDDLSDKVNMRNTDSPKETLNKSVLGDDLNEIDLASSNFDALESDPDLFKVAEKTKADSEDDD